MSSVLNIKYTDANTSFYLNSSFSILKEIVPFQKVILITDENIFKLYEDTFLPWRVICIPAGESSKSLKTVDYIISQLIAMEAGRDTIIIGVGGGVVSDISGFVAGIYKRGVRCAYIPTTILAMVDASIGGKNGLDFGNFKNMIGLIRQPEFLLYDYNFLKTLPNDEWINGFAEIIKHACILDEPMFCFLEENNISAFQKNQNNLVKLIQNNVSIKVKIVQEDEFEKGNRKILNFGHTFGHAIEALYQLSHGKAVAIGMTIAGKISSTITGFKDNERLNQLLVQYELPTIIEYDKKKVFTLLLQDKKRDSEYINYILLNKIGESFIKPISIIELDTFI